MNDLFNGALENALGTIFGGLILTLILFFLNEFVFRKKNLTGVWKATIKIESTSHKEFKDLHIEYMFHLIQKGYEISGSGEKIRDIKPDGSQIIFERKNRVTLDIDGYFERKYLSKSYIYLNIIEDGRTRESRSTYTLFCVKNNILQGTFVSTAADASGSIEMIKS